MNSIISMLFIVFGFIITQLFFLSESPYYLIFICLFTFLILWILHFKEKFQLWNMTKIYQLRKKDIIIYLLIVYGFSILGNLIIFLITKIDIKVNQEYLYDKNIYLSLAFFIKNCISFPVIEELFLGK